jgi:hypothetical protein
MLRLVTEVAVTHPVVAEAATLAAEVEVDARAAVEVEVEVDARAEVEVEVTPAAVIANWKSCCE